MLNNQQASCGVKAGLWKIVFAGERPLWETTADGQKLGLTGMNRGLGNQLFMTLPPGFAVSVKVTGLAADANGAGRTYVEATAAAKISHSCFSAGLPFWAAAFQRPGDSAVRVNVPIGFTFALFDDGWRIMW